MTSLQELRFDYLINKMNDDIPYELTKQEVKEYKYLCELWENENPNRVYYPSFG